MRLLESTLCAIRVRAGWVGVNVFITVLETCVS